MTRPTTTGKAQDLITFTRSTTGTALAKISYGEELVTNGTFDSDLTGWTTGSNVTSSYYSGAAQLTLGGAITSTGANWFSQSVFETGKLYFVTFDATYVSGGSLQAGYGFDLEVTASSSGAYSFIVNPDIGSGSLVHRERITFAGASGAVWRIDNVSVKGVLADQPDGTLQLFNHPINKPRIEYDASGNCLGLLVEEARTNLVTYSEDFTNSFFTKNGVTIQSGITAPNAKLTASKLQESETTGNHIIFSTGLPAGTLSIYAKGDGSGRLFQIRRDGGGGDSSWAWFNLDNGSVERQEQGTAEIKQINNGWYRCSLTPTNALGTVVFGLSSGATSRQVSYSGDGTSGAHIFGAQLEAGSFPTSYIPTSGSAVTRTPDVASLAVSEFGYNQDQGTVFINCLITAQPNFNLRVIDGNSNSKRWMYVNVPDNDYGLKYFDGTNNPTLVSSGIPPNMKAAVAVTPTQVFGAANSSAVGSGAHSGTLLDISQFNFFSTLNGHIKSVQYYPLRLSNAQLQALTV
jgi:hypothetical protein